MEFRDLKAQYQFMKKDIDAAIEMVMSTSDFIAGKQVKELEKVLAEYIGVKHCVTCGNGTDALFLALMVLNIGKGDAVFVPDFTFFASGEAPAFFGATPVFVDVDRDTFNISVKSLENAIKIVLEEGKLNPKAVIAVDLFGQPADYPLIKQITDKYNLFLIEDGAQGFGGAINDKMACSFGDIATTSFFPAKPFGCYGDGGAIFTDNDEWAEIIRSLCVHGKGRNKYDNVRIGMNSRLDTLQAAILQVKLRTYEQELIQVNKIAEKYSELLEGFVTTPYINSGYKSSWAQYTIICSDKQQRKKIQEALNENNIPSMIYYEKGLNEQSVFKNGLDKYIKCNNTEYLTLHVLSLPIYPYIDQGKVYECANIIKNI